MLDVAELVLERMPTEVTAIGGLTMGADGVTFITAGVAATHGRALRAFSVRKEVKDHGAGGRIAGSLVPGDKVIITEDTVTRGTSLLEAANRGDLGRHALEYQLGNVEHGLRRADGLLGVDKPRGLATGLQGEVATPHGEVQQVLPHTFTGVTHDSTTFPAPACTWPTTVAVIPASLAATRAASTLSLIHI